MRRYKAKHYESPDEYIWIGPFRLFTGHKKDLSEPVWRTLARHCYICASNHNNQAKYWYTNSKRKFRRKTRQLIKQGRYDELPVKPENVDWEIW